MSGFGDVDVAAAEPVCNCGHDLRWHERKWIYTHAKECELCRCGSFVNWGTA